MSGYQRPTALSHQAAPLVPVDVNAQFAMVFLGRMKGSARLIHKADSRHRRECLNTMVCE